jgi:hypothetical protein
MKNCKNCKFLDNKRNICLDKIIFFNKNDGLPCCRFDENAIKASEYWKKEKKNEKT